MPQEEGGSTYGIASTTLAFVTVVMYAYTLANVTQRFAKHRWAEISFGGYPLPPPTFPFFDASPICFVVREVLVGFVRAIFIIALLATSFFSPGEHLTCLMTKGANREAYRGAVTNFVLTLLIIVSWKIMQICFPAEVKKRVWAILTFKQDVVKEISIESRYYDHVLNITRFVRMTVAYLVFLAPILSLYLLYLFLVISKDESECAQADGTLAGSRNMIVAIIVTDAFSSWAYLLFAELYAKAVLRRRMAKYERDTEFGSGSMTSSTAAAKRAHTSLMYFPSL